MMEKVTLIIVTCLVFHEVFSASVRTAKIPVEGSHPLLIISFDGFRWDYLTRTKTPNFDIFLREGVTARHGLKNAFVTKTFPNHFTLVTGLWEESHGIVANDMYDPLLNQSFSPSNKSAAEDPAWFDVGAEPIWVTNQLQALEGRSGVMMWVGGGAPVKWVKPSRYIPYDGNFDNFTKIDTVVEWFTDKNPINLGLVYFSEPDGFGHEFGPDSPQVTGMIAGLDEVVGYLLLRLKEKQLLEQMNIIITSDHGFTSTPENNSINLDDYIDPDSYMLVGLTPIANVWPHEGKMDEIYANLTSGASINGHFKVYKREDVPERFHYSHNIRISPIVVVADDTFSFCRAECRYTERGNHGYDNSLQDMHPFFLAMGPSFKKNFSVDTFNNVDVYPLMCYLLGITPAMNNGSMDVVSQLLMQKKETVSTVTVVTYAIVLTLVFVIACIFIIGAVRYYHYQRRGKLGGYIGISTQEEISNRPVRSSTASEPAARSGGTKVHLLNNRDGEAQT